MPTFGDFETVGEPVALVEERRQVTTVWRAHRTGGDAGQVFAIKCYFPCRPQTGDALDEDAVTKFIEGVKELQRAGDEGGQCLARIHEFGLSTEGAWFATDYHTRTLESFITLRGKVDAEGLAHVVWSAAAGCLGLQRSRGYSHGNLKTRNIYLVGRPRVLPKTPLHLGDPYPASPYLLSRQDAESSHAAPEMLRQTLEVQDLHAIGELLFQLVEERIVHSGDHEYPVQDSPAWRALDKEGERWRGLCNQLLDINVSLEQINLEKLEQEFRPRMPGRTIAIAAAVAAAILIGGCFCLTSLFKHSAPKPEVASPMNQQETSDAINQSVTAGNGFLEQGNYQQATNEFGNALQLATGLGDATRGQDAGKRLLYVQALLEADAAKSASNVDDEIRWLQTASSNSLEITYMDSKVNQLLDEAALQKKAQQEGVLLVDEEKELAMAMASGADDFDHANYSSATNEFQTAVDLAAKIGEKDRQQEAAKRLESARLELDFSLAMKDGREALAQKDYTRAMAACQQALSLKPQNSEAQKGVAMAQGRRDEQHYNDDMAEARALLDAGKWEQAALPVQDALRIKPNDEATLGFQQRLADMTAARNDFSAGQYDDALALCKVHSGIKPFDTLAHDVETEMAKFKKAQQQFLAGHYSFIADLRGQTYSTKAPFADLLKRGAFEKGVLDQLTVLRQNNGWQAAKDVLADPANAGFASKEPFQRLKQWSDAMSLVQSPPVTPPVAPPATTPVVPPVAAPEKPGTVSTPIQTPAQASALATGPTLLGRWTNSLGIPFVPVTGTRVLFAAWDVRVKDYELYARTDPDGDQSWKNPPFPQEPECPVINVNWNQAHAFCDWLTQQERAAGSIAANQSYRLPREAEWYRAAGPTSYPWGERKSPPRQAGNYSQSLGVDHYDYTSPVGSFKPNPSGLYDMGGNVWQWCEDEYEPGQGDHVLHGASWRDSLLADLLCSSRYRLSPESRSGNVGFRIVLFDSSR